MSAYTIISSVAATLLFSLNLQAASQVSCWQNDCLKFGWTEYTSIGQHIDHSCYSEDCTSSGWISSSEPKTYTQCKEQNCFRTGWYVIDQTTQQMNLNINCRVFHGEADCLRAGWTAYSRAGQEYVVTCFLNDCRFSGWGIMYNNGIQRQIHCKAGGCFNSGWNEL